MRQEGMTILWFSCVFCAMLVPANLAPADPPNGSSFSSTTAVQNNIVSSIAALAEAQKGAQPPVANVGQAPSQAELPPVKDEQGVSVDNQKQPVEPPVKSLDAGVAANKDSADTDSADKSNQKQPAEPPIKSPDAGVAGNKANAEADSADKSKPTPHNETTANKEEEEAHVEKVQKVPSVPPNTIQKQNVAGEASERQEGAAENVAPEQDKMSVTPSQHSPESSTVTTVSKSNDTLVSGVPKDSQSVEEQSPTKVESSKVPEAVDVNIQPSDPALVIGDSENKKTGEEAAEVEQKQTQSELKEEEAGSDAVGEGPNEAEQNTNDTQGLEQPVEEEANEGDMQGAPIEENLGNEEENINDEDGLDLSNSYIYDMSSQSSMTSDVQNNPSSINQPENKERQEQGENMTNGGEFTDDEDSHFFAYFLTIMVLAIIFYLVFHNKQRIIALIIEGRSPGNRRGRRASSRGKYHKLDNNLEEAMTATKGAKYDIIY